MINLTAKRKISKQAIIWKKQVKNITFASAKIKNCK